MQEISRFFPISSMPTFSAISDSLLAQMRNNFALSPLEKRMFLSLALCTIILSYAFYYFYSRTCLRIVIYFLKLSLLQGIKQAEHFLILSMGFNLECFELKIRRNPHSSFLANRKKH